MGPLEELASQTGKEFKSLVAARERTVERLERRRSLLSNIDSADASVVLMGSWGRGEVTSGSDDDYMVLVRGESHDPPPLSVEQVADILSKDPLGFRDPGREGIFGDVVFSHDLINNIGLSEDTNANLTRRMLLLLESRVVFGDSIRDDVMRHLIGGYLETAAKAYRPPRFLLNDVVRYWRTMAVDFAAKARDRKNEGWGLKNAKLRTSRKLLFASGLIPVLRCHELAASDIPDFILTQYNMWPLDRIAQACSHFHDLEAGARIVDAYDRFLEILDNQETREHLASLDPEMSRSSDQFRAVAQLGKEIEDGLLGLLYGPALGTWTKRFGLL